MVSRQRAALTTVLALQGRGGGGKLNRGRPAILQARIWLVSHRESLTAYAEQFNPSGT